MAIDSYPSTSTPVSLQASSSSSSTSSTSSNYSSNSSMSSLNSSPTSSSPASPLNSYAKSLYQHTVSQMRKASVDQNNPASGMQA
ncbi:MAG: hypothetical protein M1814_002943 [Vezdaea aestivalis]|nr:MAG: hypothetical protein M1814_002943 [Vezdaea aestivalis]